MFWDKEQPTTKEEDTLKVFIRRVEEYNGYKAKKLNIIILDSWGIKND